MRLRRKADAALTLLLGTALCLLLYSQRESGTPAVGLASARDRMATVPAPPAFPTRPAWGPEVARAFPAAGAVLPVYEADTPEPPTPSGPFDFRRYLQAKDKRRFPLLINQPQKCRGLRGGPGPDLLIAVKSVAADFERREVVRKTWGAEGDVHRARVRRVFLLGMPRSAAGVGAQAQENLLRAEGRAYGDILLWAFDDTFFNLTLKEIHFLDWATAFCPDARFVFKGDDDVFVHVENLLEFVATRDPAQDLLAGDVILQARPIRARDSKYYIPEGVYGLGAYPAYAGGGGFVLSGATLRRLAAACAQVELFPIDDVFLGMCLQRLRLAPEPHQAFRTFGIARPSAAPHLRTFDPCFYRELVLVHGLSAADIWLMWQMLHAVPGPDCARVRTAPKPFRWGS
ncbi:UDP-GlcNAc:betaGal beta-1,3-N-acetylglucosaminyltransferase 9 [Monodelphis domestica]|uniref:Hexosyltransferase n=1 Tax=Monodelphis domestica TaxID=13616 RepID=A0A5F8HGZ2_MONDO|nr:UDP-GlcNAc:betaGal beta-1,3-N-acetylglucosaminyltransferase 9 [Monodelphis domestica]XP_056659150.1 UDP-GlcNAc:betaGal beta-1,3-N-acetylglucosaminyltransferase 9 [Monodelphis domestica]XP_056659199.1 UDP-GlcNAc:betaGal beta-1,3-N-acetylglucosaminyltransferase 9 [Monodelphis domestica]